VVAGIFIATMGAAHDYVFPWSKPTRSSDPRSRSSWSSSLLLRP